MFARTQIIFGALFAFASAQAVEKVYYQVHKIESLLPDHSKVWREWETLLYDINQDGDAVGESLVDLGVVTGFSQSSVLSTNDSGVAIVAFHQKNWAGESIYKIFKQIELLPIDGPHGNFTCGLITNAGDMLGTVKNAESGLKEILVWRHQMPGNVSLQMPGELKHCEPVAMNGRGELLLVEESPVRGGVGRCFIWSEERSFEVLIAPQPDGEYTISSATAFNNAGEIVVHAYTPSGATSVILSPLLSPPVQTRH